MTFSKPNTNQYDVLGVAMAATDREIKTAYHQLAMKCHPDVTGTGGSDESGEFDKIVKAYEYLSDPAKRAALDAALGNVRSDDFDSWPQNLGTEYVVVEGVELAVAYERHWFSSEMVATVWIRESDLASIQSLPPLSYRVELVYITDESGQEVLSSGRSLKYAREELKRSQDELRKRELRFANERKLNTFERKLKELERKGLPIEQLTKLIGDAQQKSYLSVLYRGTVVEAMAEILRAVEKEIERLKGDPAQVIFTYFMEGRINHRDIEHNQKVMARLEELAIRSDGLVELPNLQAHYEHLVKGVRTLEELRLLDLRLPREVCVSKDILDGLEVAPENIELQARKGMSIYQATYGYREVKGAQVPTCVIRIPLATFEKNAPEHGKTSAFPLFPYGIRLFVEVTPNGDDRTVIAGGYHDEERLASKVEKFRKSQQRGNVFASVDESGFKRRMPVEGTPVPPWYKGSRPR